MTRRRPYRSETRASSGMPATYPSRYPVTIGVARSRWLMGRLRPSRMVSKMLTTTYASMAASSTARPPTPTATRRATAPWSGVTGAAGASVASGSTSGCGCTDRHRGVEVGQRDGDRYRLAIGPGQLERALEHLVGAGVDPQLAGDVAGCAGDQRGDRGRVGGGRQLVRVAAVDRLLRLRGDTGRGLH